MANPTVRAMSIYWKGKKAATVNQSNFSMKTGRSPVFGAEGYLAHTKGAVISDIELDEVTPVSGSTSIDDIDEILAQDDIDIAVLIGGKIFRITMAITDAKYTSDTETGKCTGKIMLAGGKPQVT